MTDFNVFLAKAIENVPSIGESLADAIGLGGTFSPGDHFRLEGKRFAGYGHCALYVDGIKSPGPGLSVSLSRLPPLTAARTGFRPLLEALVEILYGKPKDLDLYVTSPRGGYVQAVMDSYRRSNCRLILSQDAYDAWNSNGADRKDRRGPGGWCEERLFGMKFTIIKPSELAPYPRLVGHVEALGPLIKGFVVEPKEEQVQ